LGANSAFLPSKNCEFNAFNEKKWTHIIRLERHGSAQPHNRPPIREGKPPGGDGPPSSIGPSSGACPG